MRTTVTTATCAVLLAGSLLAPAPARAQLFWDGFEFGDPGRWSSYVGFDGWWVMEIRSDVEFADERRGGEAEQHPHGIARCAANPDVIYLSHDVAGVWRSTDGGENWDKALDRGLFVRAGQSIEVDPVDCQTVVFEADNSYDWLAEGWEGLFRSTDGGDDWELVLQTDTHYDSELHRIYRHNLAFDPASVTAGGAQRWYSAFPDHGLFRSSDGGQTWTPSPVASLAGHSIVYGVWVHPDDGQTVYLGTSQGLFRSTAQGAGLQPLGDLPAGAVSSVAIDPSAPATIYVTVLDDGLYRSTNGGLNFTEIRDFDAARVFMNPGHPLTLFLVGTSSNTVTTHDGGASWIEDMVTEPFPGLGRSGSSWKSRIAGQLSGIVPNPTDANEAVAYSRATLWKTTDGGHVFADTSTGFTGFAWSWFSDGAAFDPNDWTRFAFFNCDVGMVVTHNRGDWFERRNDQAWSWYSQGLITWIGTYAGAFQPIPGSPAMVASVGGYFTTKLMTTTDEGVTWSLVPDQDDERNLVIEYHLADPNVVYAGKKMSFDGGVSFSDVDFGAYAGTDPSILGMCRSNPDTVYALDEGRERILRSDDRGNTWSEYAHVAWSFTRLDSLPTFAADPVDCDKVWAIDATGDLASFDGTSWTSTGVLALAGGTEYGNFVRSVAVDPRNNQVVYAGMHSTGVSCVWRSLDGGQTWTDITGNLPRQGAGAMAVNPHTGELFKGSAIGTWVHPPP